MTHIIIEGPDNAGKSTLAQKLSREFHIPVIPSEGREKYPGEIIERVKKYMKDGKGKHLIYDRHPVVSQRIYYNVVENTIIHYEIEKAFYDSKPVFIYCRADINRGLDGHIEKDYDDKDYLTKIEEKFSVLSNEYDKWALKKANVIYRIGDNLVPIFNFVGSVL